MQPGLDQVVPLGADEQLATLLHGFDGHHQDADHGIGPGQSLAETYRLCDRITRRHSATFFLSSALFPNEKRRAIRVLYAFCRLSDDAVDQADGDPARSLAVWVHHTHAHHPPASQPVLLAWADVRERYGIPRSLANELLAGIAMDLKISRYATFADLWLYCYRVASVVGLLAMRIIGSAPGAEPYAIKLGVALQLTNILRDVGEDARRGRVYLPEEDLARFGLTADDILNGVFDQRFIALMQFQIARAHRLYDEGWPGIALLHPDSRMAIGAAALVYRRILDKIVANGYDSYTRRAFVPTRDKLAMLPGIWRKIRALGTGQAP